MNKIYIIIIFFIAVAGLVFIVNNGKLESDMSMEVPTYNSPELTEVVALPKIVKDEKGEIKEFVVEGTNYSFSLSQIVVKKGDRVRIIFKNTQGFHDFVIDEFDVFSKQTRSPSIEILEFTVDKVGSFEFYCSIGTHRAMGMWGTFKVEE